MSAAIGVAIPSRTVLSVTWPDASLLPLPGGRPGAATRTTMGVATTLSTAQRIRKRRKWRGSDIGCVSDHVDEAVHIADRLHRPRESVDESSGAGHEALPAIAPRLPGAEREGDGLVGLVERTGHLRTLVRRVAFEALDRDGDAHLGHRERMRGSRWRDDVHGLPVDPHLAAHRPLHLGEERVPQTTLAVEVVDRDMDQRMGRDVEDG